MGTPYPLSQSTQSFSDRRAPTFPIHDLDETDEQMKSMPSSSDVSSVISETDYGSQLTATLETSGPSSAHWSHWSVVKRRTESFSERNWHVSLKKSLKTNAKRMAEVGWYCTGSRSAKCYACDKEMEEWEEVDDPTEIHLTRCPDCPLNIHRTQADPGQMTWREQIRLDVAIEFYRQSLAKRRELISIESVYKATRSGLVRQLAALKERKSINND